MPDHHALDDAQALEKKGTPGTWNHVTETMLEFCVVMSDSQVWGVRLSSGWA